MRTSNKNQENINIDNDYLLKGDRIYYKNRDLNSIKSWFTKERDVAFYRGMLEGIIPIYPLYNINCKKYHIESSATQRGAWKGVAKDLNSVLEPLLAQLIEMEIGHAGTKGRSLGSTRQFKGGI